MFRKKNQPLFFDLSERSVSRLAADFKILAGAFTGDERKVEELADLIVSKYSEKHRRYHNLSHVDALLCAAENFKDRFSDYAGVRLSVWFHDVVYEPRRSDNEIKSAELAVEKLSELNLPASIVQKVEAITLATQKHAAGDLDFDGRLFLDLDLGILGAEPSTYEHYKSAIRREYSFVPWFLYRRARAKILDGFLRREFIYFTPEMREKCEAAARRNIANEIKELS